MDIDPSLELYGYEEENIDVLMDGDDPGDLLPTEENIVRLFTACSIDMFLS